MSGRSATQSRYGRLGNCETFDNSLLFGDSRKNELVLRQVSPVRPGRKRPSRSANHMVKESFGPTDEGDQVMKKVRISRLEHVDVARAHSREVRDGHFPLIRPPFPKENLPRSKDVGERRAVGRVSPPSDLEVARIEVLQPDVAIEAVCDGITRSFATQPDHVPERDPRPPLMHRTAPLPRRRDPATRPARPSEARTRGQTPRTPPKRLRDPRARPQRR